MPPPIGLLCARIPNTSQEASPFSTCELTSLTSSISAMLREVALVIGASRGIGRQVAIDLAKNGYAGMLLRDAEGTHSLALFSGSDFTCVMTSGRCCEKYF